jgi:hypothetical protein
MVKLVKLNSPKHNMFVDGPWNKDKETQKIAWADKTKLAQSNLTTRPQIVGKFFL